MNMGTDLNTRPLKRQTLAAQMDGVSTVNPCVGFWGVFTVFLPFSVEQTPFIACQKLTDTTITTLMVHR